MKENLYNGGCFWQPLFIFYNTHKTLFNIFLNCPALTILSTDFSSFSYKHINFVAENVKSSLEYKVKPTEHKKPRWSYDMKSIVTFK